METSVDIFLRQIHSIIIDGGDSDKLINLLHKQSSLNIDSGDIITFLSSFCCINDYPAFSVCGSGGSGINKPNISSIACLYLSLLGVPIIKIGSRHRTGLWGSSDFFASYGLLNKSITHNNVKFSYYDIEYVSKWKYRLTELLQHPSFNVFFKNNSFNEFSCLGKLVGSKGPQCTNIYLSKNQINVSGQVFSYYSPLNNKYIDECTGSIVYVNNEPLSVFSEGHYSELSLDSILNIDDALIKGRLTSSFWFHSLRNTVALALHLFGYSDSVDIAYKSFDDLYNKGGIINLFL